MNSPRYLKERRHLITLVIGGLFLLSLLSYIHINQGSLSVKPYVIMEAIFNQQNNIVHNVIRDLRLPRLTIGIIAGGALGVSGVLFQSLLRNPMASSSTLGINAGAYFIVILFSVYIPSHLIGVMYVPAFLGALLTAILVYFLGGGRRVNPVQMALAGVALSLVFSSMTAALQILYSNETSGLFLWGSGSLIQSGWKGVQFSYPLVFLTILVVLLMAKTLDIMALGDDVATSLGVHVNTYRVIGMLLGVILTSAVITIVGPIGFVGLVAPHLIKQMGFKKHNQITILSFIWGSVILVGADVVSRLFTSSSYELPVGAFTALVGAPWLIYLAYKTSKTMVNTNEGLFLDVNARKIPYCLLVILLLLLLVGVFFFSLQAGGQRYNFYEIFLSIIGKGTTVSNLIINQIRLPRILTALIAGSLLGISGFLLQTVLKNPLVDASTLGITPGAALGAILFLNYIPGNSPYITAFGAFLGAILAASFVFIITKKSKLNPLMMILVGMAVTAIASAGVSIMVVNTTVGKATSLVWLAGSTYSSNWGDVIILLISLIIFLPFAWLLGKDLDAMMLGDDLATSIGASVLKIRILSSVIGIMIAAIAVTTVGTIGFIGLLAPHMARLLVGLNNRKGLIITTLIGGLILLVSDLIGRVIIFPGEVPSGLVVAVIGGPYFIWLMYHASKVKR